MAVSDGQKTDVSACTKLTRLGLLLVAACAATTPALVDAQRVGGSGFEQPNATVVIDRRQVPDRFASGRRDAPSISPPAAQILSAREESTQPLRHVSEHPSDDEAVQYASHTEPAPPSKYERIPLRSGRERRLSPGAGQPTGATRATTTVVTSLAVVLGAFFLLVWLSRKAGPKGLTPLPGEVVESLGRAQLTARQQMQLVRVGSKLVLLAITPTGVETITEVTNVEEVDRLCSLCQQSRSSSITATFQQVLSQYASEPAPAGFIGDPSATQVELANGDAQRDRHTEDEDA